MSIVYIVLGDIAVLILIVIAIAMSKPADFRIQRSAVIQAPASRIFAHINDFVAWRAWSPWEKKDPVMQRELSPATSGKGATYEWRGDKNVGHGRMTILESIPDSRILIQLDFISPFEAHNQAEFLLTPEGTGTKVNWAMTGKSNFISRIMCVFFDMEKMVGPDFEAGLAELKRLSKQPA
jgi:uncharacterized protein YndB with AHSA1/START domain